MNLTIVVDQGADTPVSRNLETGTYALGRDPAGGIPVTGSGSEAVSWNHAELSVRSEGVFLKDLNSSNGTWLNGKKIRVETKILDGDEIRLGQSGPRIRVEKTAAAVTQPGPTSKPADGPLAYGSKSMAESSPLAGSKGPPSLQGKFRPAVVTQKQPPPSPPKPPVSSPPPAQKERKSSTTRAMLIDLKKSQQGWRGLGIAAMVVLCITLVVSLVLFGGKLSSESEKAQELAKQNENLAKQTDQLKGQTAKLTGQTAKLSGETKKLQSDVKKRPKSDLDTKAIFAANRASVYLVGLIRGTKVTPFGTAFAIDENGTFGTNAHITEPLKDFLKRGAPFYVIGEGGKAKYRILSAKTHPGYRSKRPRGTYSPDVGILKVQVPTGTKLKHVSLGEADDFKDLSDGSKLCYIGFPVYLGNDYSDLSQVKARINPGSVIRMLTLKGKVGDHKDQFILEHNMMAWGGASGSPIFNGRGRVVGLHFSSSSVITDLTTVTSTGTGSRKKFKVTKTKVRLGRTPSSTKYGIRADKLLELLK